MSESPRTSKLAILGRFGLLGWSIGVTLFHAAAALGVAVTIGPFILGAVLGIGLLVLFVWAVVRLVGFVLFGNDPQYQEFINTGGDPYLDFLPPPFNTDADAQRLGVLNEPEHLYLNNGNRQSCHCPFCNEVVWEISPGDFNGLVICWNCSQTFSPYSSWESDLEVPT
ncbi:hypothetical protein C5Y96_18870 [Blastopirellula marina]|uniref:Uncharacterized protein n=1 Tax=Blastopirellula marina TaxID=124 RepID=A0A2S8F613_9BACT|nr:MULTISPECIES: hypothetical protein [Pirellulaceae]PQO27591.1 hypothetical protein C5Y96_18870 [Blastopirellula marina]RCS48128.1 hypothetical protein DTL36_18895 [Bremerella cremea]